MATNQSIHHKLYSKAPLPFVGQKRNFIKAFRQILTDHITDDGEGWTIVDVFGGSGLLAHNAKHLCPKATVIYNDYDDYADRLAHINDTNRLRQELFEILKDEPRSTKLSNTAKTKVLDHLRKSADNGTFVDVQTLAGWLLFSGRQVGSLDELLAESTFYNRIVKADYKNADDYLDGLSLECLDFEKLLQKYQDIPNCLLLLDPPYLCTAQGAYAKHGYFGMTKFLTLMHYVRPPYVFFSSTRSELLDYMDYLKTYDPQKWQIVGGFDRVVVNASVNARACYEDNILSKF